MDSPPSEPGPLALVLILLAFPVVFIGFWSAVCALLAFVGGWRGLAGRFRTETEQPHSAETPTGAMLGVVSYKSVLEVAFAEDGLDLRVMMMFRPGHPPLRIPWDQVEYQGEAASLFRKRVRIRLGGGPVLRIPADLWVRSGRS